MKYLVFILFVVGCGNDVVMLSTIEKCTSACKESGSVMLSVTAFECKCQVLALKENKDIKQ